SVTEAADGSIWIGYLEPVGISRIVPLEGGFRVQHHIPSPDPWKVYFLGATPEGSVWVGTSAGVHVLDAGRWKHYGREDGLIWNDTDRNGFFADRNGDIFISTSRGL